MDLANRFVIILLALLLIFAAAVVVLLAWGAGTESVERLSDFVAYLNDHVDNEGAKIILSLGGLVVALLALMVVFVELAPPTASTVQVREVRAGNAVLSTEAVARRLEEEVARVPNVVRSKATVAARGNGVDVSLELEVEPDTKLTSTSEAACQAVQEVVANQLGVELVDLPTVKLGFARGPRPAAVAPEPAADQPPLAAPSEAPAGGDPAEPPPAG